MEENGEQDLINFFIFGILISDSALAQESLARSKNCLACHAVSTKMIGPAFQEVAKRYANQKDAEEKLVKKVLKGSVGVSGTVPMPANPHVSETEARSLAKWVLDRK